MSGTIPGCERGVEESRGREPGIRPEARIQPRTLLQMSATASSAETDNPPPATGEAARQVDFFPAPFPFPPERPELPEDEEKGALPLRPFFAVPERADGEGADAFF